MALDRFIQNPQKPVIVSEIEHFIRSMFGNAEKFGLNDSLKTSGEKWARLYIDIPGKSTTDCEINKRDCRWIEVYIDETEQYINIITRMQDMFTRMIADGLADKLALHWNGKLTF